MLKSIFLIVVGIPALVGCKPQAPEFSLVKDGKPQATIVIAQAPSKTTRFAVQELTEHLELVAGAKLPVVDDTAEVKGPRVLVGESAATRALGINTADFKHQEYLVRATDDTLVLLGKEEDATLEKPTELFVPGKWGKAISFDGKTTILDIPKSGFNDAEGTLECWVLMDGSASGAILRVSSSDLGGVPGFRNGANDHVILLRQGNVIRYRSISDGKESALVSQPISSGWHHVMATYSTASGKIELFIDGQSQGTAPICVNLIIISLHRLINSCQLAFPLFPWRGLQRFPQAPARSQYMPQTKAWSHNRPQAIARLNDLSPVAPVRIDIPRGKKNPPPTKSARSIMPKAF
ncbi:MAG: LamG-like jellyroll fold domain-containing protein [Spartobacteria bacterium]